MKLEGDGDLNMEAEIGPERATERDGSEKPCGQWLVQESLPVGQGWRPASPSPQWGAPKGRLGPGEDEVAAGGP